MARESAISSGREAKAQRKAANKAIQAAQVAAKEAKKAANRAKQMENKNKQYAKSKNHTEVLSAWAKDLTNFVRSRNCQGRMRMDQGVDNFWNSFPDRAPCKITWIVDHAPDLFIERIDGKKSNSSIVLRQPQNIQAKSCNGGGGGGGGDGGSGGITFPLEAHDDPEYGLLPTLGEDDPNFNYSASGVVTVVDERLRLARIRAKDSRTDEGNKGEEEDEEEEEEQGSTAAAASEAPSVATNATAARRAKGRWSHRRKQLQRIEKRQRELDESADELRRKMARIRSRREEQEAQKMKEQIQAQAPVDSGSGGEGTAAAAATATAPSAAAAVEQPAAPAPAPAQHQPAATEDTQPAEMSAAAMRRTCTRPPTPEFD